MSESARSDYATSGTGSLIGEFRASERGTLLTTLPVPRGVRDAGNGWADFHATAGTNRFFLKDAAGGLKGISEHDYYAASKVPPRYRRDGKSDIDAINEWLAETTLVLYNEVYFHYSTVANENERWQSSCNGDINFGYPPGVRFFWKENGQKKALPADQYVLKLLVGIEEQISNEDIFPEDTAIPFPGNFRQVVGKLFCRMFRVYAIIYSNECLLGKLQEDGREYLEYSFKTFVYFGLYWKLMRSRDMDHMLKAAVKQIFEEYKNDQETHNDSTDLH